MMAKRMKRTLALALSLVMVLGLLPAAAFAARVEDEYDSTAQIVDAGGTRYFKKDGNGVAETTKEAGDAILEITKSVAGTQVENEFEITLQVKTTEDLTTIPRQDPRQRRGAGAGRVQQYGRLRQVRQGAGPC